MHEMAAAHSIKDFVKERVEEKGFSQPSRVEVVAGPGYSAENVQDSLEKLLPETVVDVRDEDCPNCGRTAEGEVCTCGEELEKGCRVVDLRAGKD